MGPLNNEVPLNSPIVIADYDGAWPDLFRREAERIRAVLGSMALRIEHAGSTSVPGLAAKPIIDIVHQPARLFGRLPGDRSHADVPRLVAR